MKLYASVICWLMPLNMIVYVRAAYGLAMHDHHHDHHHAQRSHLTFEASVRPENAVTYSVGNEGQNICGVFSDTASFQSYGTCCIVRPPCSRPFSLCEYTRELLKCHVDSGAEFRQ